MQSQPVGSSAANSATGKLSLAEQLDTLDGKFDGYIRWQGIEKYLRQFSGPLPGRGPVAARWTAIKAGKKNNPAGGHIQAYLIDHEITRASKSLEVNLWDKKFGVSTTRNYMRGSGLEDLGQSLVAAGVGGWKNKTEFRKGMTYEQFYALQRKY
jgi:hypothetical protein